jgi:peroxiredoxin
MMRLINKQAAALERHGVRLMLVTPSEGEIDDEFATHLAFETRMLLDRGAATAKRLGLLDVNKRDGQDVPLPVGLLIDPTGIVRDITRPDDVATYVDERKLEAALGAAA